MISGSGAIRKATIGKTASGALLDEKGPHGGGHENETVAKLEDIKPSVPPFGTAGPHCLWRR